MPLFFRLPILAACLLLASCATQIKPPKTINPPPLEAFSAYDQFELKPVELSSAYADHSANQKAAAKIQEYVDTRVKPVIAEWNQKNPAGSKTLLIEPRIEHIKFIGIGARIWVGPLAGSSAVVMKVKYSDKTSGRVIAEPEFYQRAAAMSGAMTFGGQDNAMLARITTLIAEYNARNYTQRVGGENGMSAEAPTENNRPGTSP